MFKVYYEPYCFQLLAKTSSSEGSPPAIIDNNGSNIFDAFTKWALAAPSADLSVATEDPHRAWAEFCSCLIRLDAAGGLVQNPRKEIMMIERLGKWDLPKGKPEGHENHEQTAIREVAEECGIGGLQVVASLPVTHHAYLDPNHMWALKTTYWYQMTASIWQHPVPQKNESITQAKWASRKEAERLKNHAYRSISDLLGFFLAGKQHRDYL